MMAQVKIEVEVEQIWKFKSLLELIGDNLECISDPLKSRLLESIENDEMGWVIWSDLYEHIDSDNCTVMMDGEEQFYVTKYNKMLRKVSVFNAETKKIDTYIASSFSVANNGCPPYVEWDDAT